MRLLLGALLAMLTYATPGCSSAGHDHDKEKQAQPNNASLETPSVAQSSYGIYVARHYVRYRGGLTPESEIRKLIGDRLRLENGLFEFSGTRITNPKYSIHYYDLPAEGNIPPPEQRVLMRFYGLGAERDVVTVLQVRTPDTGTLLRSFEIISKDELWMGIDGWAVQMVRVDTAEHIVPVSER